MFPPAATTFTAKATDSAGPSALSDLGLTCLLPAAAAAACKAPILPPTLPAYDLTALGTADWAHWGREGGMNFDHKSTGWGQISDVTLIGSGHNSYNGAGNPRAATWTDGTPTESISDEAGYYYTEALQSGWSFTVPADTTPRKLFVYCGGWGVFQTLKASLSDFSAPDYVETYQHNANYQNVYEIDYQAGSAGQTLTVTLLKTGNEPGGNGSVDLKAAWLVGGTLRHHRQHQGCRGQAEPLDHAAPIPPAPSWLGKPTTSRRHNGTMSRTSPSPPSRMARLRPPLTSLRAQPGSTRC